MTYSLPVAPPSSVWPLQLLRREGWEGLAELAQGTEIYWAKEAVLPRVGLKERNEVLAGASGPQAGPTSLQVSTLPCLSLMVLSLLETIFISYLLHLATTQPPSGHASLAPFPASIVHQPKDMLFRCAPERKHRP